MVDQAAADRHRPLTLSDFESDTTLDDVLDLSCPGCGADLLNDELYDSHRVCGTCQRHFPMRPRERIALLADANSFVEMNEVLLSMDPVRFGNADQGTGDTNALAEAVVTGVATFGGLAGERYEGERGGDEQGPGEALRTRTGTGHGHSS